MEGGDEAFCREYIANGGIATEAYAHAFPTKDGTPRPAASLRTMASRKLRNPNIQARIAEIREEAAERADASLDQINDRLDAAYLMAQKQGDAKGMTAAALGKAKLNGMLVEKTETKTTHEIAPGMAREILTNLAAKYLPPAGPAQ